MSRARAVGRAAPMLVILAVCALAPLVPAAASTASAASINARSPAVLGAQADCTGQVTCVVSWESARPPVRIYAGTRPGAVDRTRPVAVVTSGTSATVPADPSGRRTYFEVVAAHDREGPVVGDRFVGLDGAPATRDLGGYQTADGRETRWGVLFRSDGLGALTEADHSRLAAMGLPAACPESQTRHRDRDRGGDRGRGGRPRDRCRRAGSRRKLLRSLARGPLPRFVTCTLLDDRAGWAAALVLTTLGVREETVVADHLAATPRAANVLPSRAPIDAAFQAVHDRYHSFTRYLVKGLGLDARTYRRLRARLTEPIVAGQRSGATPPGR